MVTTDLHTFSVNAMATLFTVMIRHSERGYAEQAATEAFRVLNEIEAELSFFIPNSQVSKINSISEGETIVINEHCLDCLSLALKYGTITNGAFYPFSGFLKMNSPVPEIRMASDMIYLDNDKRSVTVKTKPLWLDLGGIAKGYAVEKMRQLLSEWDISNFLISGGKSSVYANGSCDNNEGWVVAIFDPYDNHSLKRRLTLNNKSVGSSGTEKGGHIFDPITRKITNNKRFAWVTGPDAVMTECFSTAAIILGREQTEELLEMFPGSECLIL